MPKWNAQHIWYYCISECNRYVCFKTSRKEFSFACSFYLSKKRVQSDTERSIEAKRCSKYENFLSQRKWTICLVKENGDWVKSQQNYYRNLLSNRRHARQMCTVCRSFYILCKTSWKPQWFEIRCRWYRSFAKALNYSTTYIFHV